MSADGQIDIAVKAEGVEDAAAEMAESDGGGGGGIDVGGASIGKGNIRSLAKGGLIGIVIASLDSILAVLKPILGVLTAFLAPLSIMLFRLFQPVLRLLLMALPYWIDLVEDITEGVDFVLDWVKNLGSITREWLSKLPGLIVGLMVSRIALLGATLAAIGSAIWGAIKGGASWLTEVPSKLASWLSGVGVKILSDATRGAIDTGAAIVDPRQPFKIRDIPINTPFTGREPEPLTDRQVRVILDSDLPEWIKASVRDQNVSTSP